MKKLIALTACAALLVLLGACGEKAPSSAVEAAPAAEPAAAAPAGETVDNEYFRLTLAAGWKAGPPTMGMVNVLPADGRRSPGLYFKFEGHGNAAGTAEGSIQSMIDRYQGSPMEETIIAGVPFKTTTYTFGKSVQTMHVAFRQGTKVTITIEGQDGKNNPDIQAMLQSLELK